jgi:hypothetical protein
MGLGVYLIADSTQELSTESTFEKPFSLTFDGRTGGVKQAKLYIRNNDAQFYYENIKVGLSDSGPESIIDQPAEGFVWKLAAGDVQPTENDWKNTAAATIVDLENIGGAGNPDTSTFLPFWVFVQIPPGLDVQTFDTVKFTLTADEVLI